MQFILTDNSCDEAAEFGRIIKLVQGALRRHLISTDAALGRGQLAVENMAVSKVSSGGVR